MAGRSPTQASGAVASRPLAKRPGKRSLLPASAQRQGRGSGVILAEWPALLRQECAGDVSSMLAGS
jgi:hypothetical protein